MRKHLLRPCNEILNPGVKRNALSSRSAVHDKCSSCTFDILTWNKVGLRMELEKGRLGRTGQNRARAAPQGSSSGTLVRYD